MGAAEGVPPTHRWHLPVLLSWPLTCVAHHCAAFVALQTSVSCSSTGMLIR